MEVRTVMCHPHGTRHEHAAFLRRKEKVNPVEVRGTEKLRVSFSGRKA